MHKHLIPADPTHVMLAVLHIMLGITMSLWVKLMTAVQSVDKDTFMSKKYTGGIILKTNHHVVRKKNVINLASKSKEEAEKRKKNCHKIYKITMNRYKEQSHPLSTEQNEIPDALKQDWSESLDILKHRSKEYKN